jgi:hypothetical protein
MNLYKKPCKNKKITAVKIINKLLINKISYSTFYKHNMIYHLTKIYFKNKKHIYYIEKKLNLFSVGDIVTITYNKYNNNKRYIKRMSFFLI